MNWIAQTGHVAAKDVRHTWVQLAAYVAILVTAAVSVVAGRALGPYSPTSSIEVLGANDTFVFFLPICTVFLGLLFAASLLQADSPTRATAFWASRPLSAWAVLTSKVGLICLTIVALPLVAALVALRSFDASAALTTSTLAHAALEYSEWLIVAMVLGAVTDDLRAFIGAFAIIAVALVVVVGGLSDLVPTSVGFGASSAVVVLDMLQAAGLVGGAVLLAYLYRTHERGRRAWIACVLVASCLIFTSLASPSEARSAPLALPDGPPLEVTPVDAATAGQPRSVQAEVAVPRRSDSLRLEFRPDSMRIDTRQGTSIDRPIAVVPQTIADDMLPPVGQPVRWLFDQASTGAHGRVTYMLDDLEEPAAASGITSVTLGGVVTAYRPRVVASLPLRVGAVATTGGRHLEIYGFSHGLTQAEVGIHLSDVMDGSYEHEHDAPTVSSLQFVIVNAARSEAILVDHAQGSTVNSPDWIVLPWIGVTSSYTQFVTNASGHEALLPQDDAWYRGARLVVVEWVAANRYRASGKMVMP